MDFSSLLHNSYLPLLWVSILTQLVSILMLVSGRATEAQKYILSALNETLVYNLGCAIHYMGYTMETLTIGIKIQYITMFFLNLALYTIFRQVYNEKNSRGFVIFLIVLGVVANIPMVGAAVDGEGIFSWFFAGYGLQEINGVKFIISSRTAFEIAYVCFAALFILLQLGVFIKSFFIAKMRKYENSVTFFYVALIPQIVIILDLFFGWYRKDIPVQPLICIIGSIHCVAMMNKGKVSNLYDASRRAIMNSMTDPLFIVDNRYYVRYANNAAKILFPEYRTLSDDSYNRLKACSELQDIITPPIHEVLMENDFLVIGKNVYRHSLHRIGTTKYLQGYIITLEDVTEQKFRNDMLEEQNSKLSSLLKLRKNSAITAKDKMISGAMLFVKDKDPVTADHMRRTSNYTFVIAREMRRLGTYADILTDSYMETLGQVAPIHDLGKIMIPSEIKEKTELTDDERRTMRSHVMIGMQIVDRMIVNNQDDLFYRLAKEVTQYHHEWWDGSGYPNGLIREEIPLSARIVAVADVFDNISSRQASKDMHLFEEAFSMIEESSGKRFDPEVVEAVVSAKEKLKSLYDQMFV